MTLANLKKVQIKKSSMQKGGNLNTSGQQMDHQSLLSIVFNGVHTQSALARTHAHARAHIHRHSDPLTQGRQRAHLLLQAPPQPRQQ